MTTEYRKPLPRITTDNRPFWEATKRHELRLQRCGACGVYVHAVSRRCFGILFAQ